MMDQSVVLDLVGKIYEAAVDAGAWPPLLSAIADVVRSNNVIFGVADFNTGRGQFNASFGLDPHYQRLHEEYYWSVQPFAKPNSLPLIEQGKAVLTPQIIGDTELDRTEFGADFLRPQDTFYAAIISMKRFGNSVVHLSAGRPRRWGPHTAEETALLSTLAPHLVSAAQIRLRIGALEQETEMLSSSLDRMPYAVLFCGPTGRASFVNAAANQILATQDGLRLKGDGTLVAAVSNDTSCLRRAVVQAAATASGNGIDAGAVVSVRRPSGKPPFAVLVLPLRASESLLMEPASGAMICIFDPSLHVPVVTERLQHLFGLTMAEARLSTELAQGMAIQDVADELGITMNTAKTHLKHIYLKTNTARLSDLVRLVLTSPAMLRRR